ncbi:hypothetical protein EBS80_02210, partial [bacterium]|nr:hypothetical protein [bacterium]
TADYGFVEETVAEPVPTLDTVAYDAKLRQLAHFGAEEIVEAPESDAETGAAVPVTVSLWPANAAYPNVGALLPFNRIVAYYGNFYSTGMGVLGQYAPDTVIEMLKGEVAKWNEADPTTPVLPAIDYIAVTAQAGAGKDGMYRARMPDAQIDKAVTMADEVGGIVILEVQPGLADIMDEVRALEPYLLMPQVHLAIDPEFAMRASGKAPGTVVGTVDATQVNAVAEYLATLVRDNVLPPKILMVHRYTRPMVTNATDIEPLPEVQIIMDMDGWGPPSQKIASYEAYIAPYPVQFTGFKLFYKNDTLRVGSRMLTPAEILELTPSPSFIQYQ